MSYEDWGRVSFGQPLCNKSLNKNKIALNEIKDVLLKCKKGLNQSSGVKGYQSVLNAKSDVEPKKSILNIDLCVELN